MEEEGGEVELSDLLLFANSSTRGEQRMIYNGASENNSAFFPLGSKRGSLPVVVEEVVEVVVVVEEAVTFAFLAFLPEGQAGRVDGRAGTHGSRLAHCGAERAQRRHVSRFKDNTK